MNHTNYDRVNFIMEKHFCNSEKKVKQHQRGINALSEDIMYKIYVKQQTVQFGELCHSHVLNLLCNASDMKEELRTSPTVIPSGIPSFSSLFFCVPSLSHFGCQNRCRIFCHLSASTTVTRIPSLNHMPSQFQNLIHYSQSNRFISPSRICVLWTQEWMQIQPIPYYLSKLLVLFLKLFQIKCELEGKRQAILATSMNCRPVSSTHCLCVKPLYCLISTCKLSL